MHSIPWWRRFDPLLVLLPLLLVIYGMALIHSATCQPDCQQWLPPSTWAIRHAIFALIGFVAMGFVSCLDYRLSRALAYYGYLASLGLLVVVLYVGHEGGDQDYGARRWIDLGFFDLQASEVAKIGLILALARWLSGANGQSLSWRRLAGSMGLLLPPIALVFAQPDLGTTLSLVAIWVAMVCGAGLKLTQGLVLAASAAASLPLVWLGLLRGYMQERILIFVNVLLYPTKIDPFAEGYNMLQAQIAIGSGGLFGRGLTQGTQTQLDYLRVKHSDFIFTVLAEETGFIGAMLLFVLVMILLFRILRVADRARDEFGRLLAFGIAAWLLFQVFVNLGSNLTLLPVTGMPLPFLSVGGSSLVTILVSLGLLQSVLLRRMKYRY